MDVPWFISLVSSDFLKGCISFIFIGRESMWHSLAFKDDCPGQGLSSLVVYLPRGVRLEVVQPSMCMAKPWWKTSASSYSVTIVMTQLILAVGTLRLFVGITPSQSVPEWM